MSWAGVDMWENYVGLDKARCDKLEKEADDLTMASIYTLECNSCKMLRKLAKRFGLGNDDYCHTLNDAQPVHRTVFPKEHHNNNKDDDKHDEDEGHVVHVAILTKSQQQKYEAVMAMVHNGHR